MQFGIMRVWRHKDDAVDSIDMPTVGGQVDSGRMHVRVPARKDRLPDAGLGEIGCGIIRVSRRYLSVLIREA